MLQLKGKPVAESIYGRIKSRLNQSGLKPHLAVILVGEDPASKVYVASKEKACFELGYKSTLIRLPADISEIKLIEKIVELNIDNSVDGILLQLPLPLHLDARTMTNHISPAKDADSLTTYSLGLLMGGQQVVSSCTPAGIMEILKFYDQKVARKNVLVIGRSLIVGMPLFHLLSQANATVTMAHSQTENLKELVKSFDFVFVAVGKPHFLSAGDFKKGAVVIDVGIHRTPTGLVGDVDGTGALGHLSALSPVPGGVGPMTIAMLMLNTLTLTEKARLA
jgi:methylenetetrahydrofolate dehydrogenase (NADP+)/methenyltetrahydrofolate cyclohydrolase